MYEILKKLGLSSDEIEIYVHLLKKGPSKVVNISREINIARTTVYRFIDSLRNKGLVSEYLSNNVKIFKAIDPNKIPNIYEERIGEIKSIIPSLEKLQNISLNNTSVELFKGKESFKFLFEDLIKDANDYVLVGETQKFFDLLEFSTIQWIKKAEAKKIKGKVLTKKGEAIKITKYEKIKFLPFEVNHITTSLTYGDKTVIFIWTEPLHAILINNKEISGANIEYFNYLWELSINPTKKELDEMKA